MPAVDPQRHLSDETILDFVAGKLDEGADAAVHEHIDDCALCRALIAAAAHGPRGAAGAGAASETMIQTRVEGHHAATPFPTFSIEEYRVRAVLGRGGMGTVYVAHDELLDRAVALKVIALGADPALRERLLVEARAAARIKHRNVATVFRVGEHEGQPFVVSELVRGRPLRDLQRPMRWPKVLEIGIGIAHGLAAVHRRGILHRDITPGNVLLDHAGEVVLVDFGLAKIAAEPVPGVAAASTPSEAAVAGGLTMTGTIMGTPRYMSPEAWRGEAATPQSDLYSLGVVLYEMVSGQTPFADARGPELGALVVGGDAPSLATTGADVPLELVTIIDRCLRRDPAERPRSAESLGAELETLEVQKSLARMGGAARPSTHALRRPYPGRAAFTTDDRAIFFGRRAEIRTVLERLHASPLVVVVGAAASGKTSLCRAGILPLIPEGALGEARRWWGFEVAPSPDPLGAVADALSSHVGLDAAATRRLAADDPAELAARLARGHGIELCSGHLVYLDALDDLFAAAGPGDASTLADVIAHLCDPTPGVRVLATCRTESLDRLAAHPALAAHLGPSLFFLSEPRTEEALRDIITAPARVAGDPLPPSITDPLVHSATRGDLPLASLAVRLADAWSSRPDASAHAS